MRAIHWSSTNQARQIALCTTPLTQQGNNHSAMPPQAAQLLHALAAPLYWQAGAAVGLAQGYAYAAAEVCAALGFSDLERQFRAYVPPQEPASESPAAVGSSSQDQPGRPATVTGATPAPLPLQQAGAAMSPAATAAAAAAATASSHVDAAVVDAATRIVTTCGPETLPGQAVQQQQQQEEEYDMSVAATPGAFAAGSLLIQPAADAGLFASDAAAVAAAATAAAAAAANAGALQQQPVTEFIPLTGTPAEAPYQPHADTSDQQQQQQQQAGLTPGALAALDRRLSSFALDHISPATTATTLALSPASLAQVDDGGQDNLAGSSGVDVGVGPLEPIEGELELSITNSTGNNLLPASFPDNSPAGGLAATAAAAAAAVAAATALGTAAAEEYDARPAVSSFDQAGSSSGAFKTTPAAALAAARGAGGASGGSHGPYVGSSSAILPPAPGSGEFKVGLPAQRHIRSSSSSSSPGSSAGSNGGSPNLSSQANAFVKPAAAPEATGAKGGRGSQRVTFAVHQGEDGSERPAAPAAAAAADVASAGDQRKQRGLFGKLLEKMAKRGSRQDRA